MTSKLKVNTSKTTAPADIEARAVFIESGAYEYEIEAREDGALYIRCLDGPVSIEPSMANVFVVRPV